MGRPVIMSDVLVASGEPIDLDVGEEKCPVCREPLANGVEEIAGVIAEDDQGLPGFALFHESCLLLRLMK